MTLRKFVVRHHKVLFLMLAVVLLLAVGGVVLLNSDDTKAEVYIQNEQDEYVSRNDIQILEIVAQNGQQVLGYGVTGSEPISKTAIESYTGSATFDFADFRNITGYEVSLGGTQYKVSKNVMDDAFNENVLNDSMSANQITVTACQANQLTADLIHNADLIFINTNNYGSNNLLYYYDQFVNGGANGILPGDMGANYNSTIENLSLANELILEEFKKACHRPAVAKRLTAEDYLRLGILNFKECNLEAYCKALGNKERDAFESATLDDLQKIIDLVESVNNTEYSKAISLIRKSRNTSELDGELVDDLYQALFKADFIDIYEINKNNYVEKLIKSTSSELNKPKNIQKVLNAVTVEQRKQSMWKLFTYKNESNEQNRGYMDIDSPRQVDLRNSILKMAIPELIDVLAKDYAIAFMEASFQFSDTIDITNTTDTSSHADALEDMRALIVQVNAAKKAEALATIGNAVGNAEAFDTLNSDAAFYFETATIDGYLEYNLDAYLAKLQTMTDAEVFKTDGNFDEAKIKAVLIDVVNQEELYDVDYITSDISWEMALELYEYAIVNEGALMYDTSIMSSIGNYNENLETNTCNMYKILLLMRQLQPAYCQSEILPYIDELGSYYPSHVLGEGTAVSAWYKDTFCNSADEASLDKSKFREPAVVGNTYGLQGGEGTVYVQGNTANYVYKHIYSFTGEQFFGGAAFTIAGNGNNYLSTNTATATTSIPEDPTLSVETNAILKDGDKAKIIRYIMELQLNFFDSYPINILEIQPVANKKGYWDDATKLQYLATCLGLDLAIDSSNYTDYFQVTFMSVKEFNTRQEDITGMYDLIYMGVDPGYQTVNNTTDLRTVFNDTSMNGLVYYGLGDLITVDKYMKGTVASDYTKVSATLSGIRKNEYDYWYNNYGKQIGLGSAGSGKIWVINTSKTTTRLTGNDLTVKSMNRLLDYVKTGYPIILDENLFKADTNPSKPYVANNSKMYNFIHTIKTLGWNASKNDFDGFDSSGNRIFKDGYNYANIVRMNEAAGDTNPAKTGKNPENNYSTRIEFKGGLSYAMKRSTKVSFQLIESPQQYQYKNGVTAVYAPEEDDSAVRIASGQTGSYVTNTSSYRFVVEVNSEVTADWLENNYNYQVYIDKSGTGRFDEMDTLTLDPTHVYKKVKKTVNGKDVTKLQIVLQGRWPGNMEGYIPWRVEVSRKDNSNNHYTYTGYSAFKTAKKKKVYLLWVQTESDIGLSLDFATAIKNNKSSIQDYDIEIMSLPYSKFNTMWNGMGLNTEFTESNSVLKVKTVYDKFASYFDAENSTRCTINKKETGYKNNQEFDMIVFGFCDMYSAQDITSIPAINNLKYFTDAGHSMMFAHDNASYIASLNFYQSATGQMQTWSRHTTPLLRSLLGMDAYGSGYSVNEANDAVLQVARNNARAYLNGSEVDYRGHSEMYSFIRGYTTPQKIYTSGIHKTSNKVLDIHGYDQVETVTTKVNRMNQGQLSDYPFVIGEDLDIALTHAQYMSLNLEIEDLTVWYTLGYAKNTSGDLDADGTVEVGETGINMGHYYRATKGDGANNFYIYSKGNITYTGAGHGTDMTPTEIKLFINTVVASIKAGNYAPEVVFPDAVSNANGDNVIEHYPNEEDGLEVAFKPIDYDSMTNVAGSFTDCKVFIDLPDENGELNGTYDPGRDIPLFVEGEINRLVDPVTGQSIDLTGSRLINRQTYYFEIPEDVLKNVIGETNLYTYPIVVQLTDAGTKNDPTKKTTISNSLYVARSELHNLR